MSGNAEPGVSLDRLQMMAEEAGLGMSREEVEELKPLYDLYIPYLRQLRSIDLGAEEISLSFHPDWDA
jgi:hypothetical protein